MRFCIGIGTIDKNIIYILVGGIFRFIMHMFLEDNIILYLYDHPIISDLSVSFGLSVAIIPLIIYKVRNKELLCSKPEEKEEKNDLVYTDLYEEIIYGKYKLILFSCIIDYTQLFIVNAFCLGCKVHMWIFDILFISLFSYLIFDFKLYRHHHISMAIIIIIGISLDVYLSNYIFNDNDYILRMIIKFISEIFLSLGIVLDKYLMEIKFCSPFEICFFHGIFGVVLSLIILTFSNEIGLDDCYKFFENPSLDKFYAFISVMFIQLIYNIFILVVIKNTTTCHILIILVIAQFAPYIKGLTDTNKTQNYIILSTSFLIIFFFSLIFNEIIEIKCLGIHKNTKKNIALRAKVVEKLSDSNSEKTERTESDIFLDDEDKKVNSDA